MSEFQHCENHKVKTENVRALCYDVPARSDRDLQGALRLMGSVLALHGSAIPFIPWLSSQAPAGGRGRRGGRASAGCVSCMSNRTDAWRGGRVSVQAATLCGRQRQTGSHVLIWSQFEGSC